MIMVVEPVTGEVLAEHGLVGPGETSIVDAHYGRPRPDRPGGPRDLGPRSRRTSAPWARSPRRSWSGAAAAGVSKLGGELADIVALQAAHGDWRLLAALQRAVTYRRWRAADIRSILAAGGHAPTPRPAGRAARQVLTLPSVPTRARCGIGTTRSRPSRRGEPVTAAPPALAADLTDGLKRLKMAAMRRLAPELLVTARTQRWNPEEFLRTLVEAEIAARDASNARTRRRQAGFPVDQDVGRVRPDRVLDTAGRRSTTLLRWNGSGPPRTSASSVRPGLASRHLLLALGNAAVDAGHRVRYLPAAELVETLYRGLADNSVGRVIDTLLRNELIIVDELGFAPLDDTGAQLLFRFVAAAYERRSLGLGLALAVRILGTVPARTHHRRQHARPAPPPLPRRHHRRRKLPHAPSPQPRRNQDQQTLEATREVGTFRWPPAGTTNWPLTGPTWTLADDRLSGRRNLCQQGVGGSSPVGSTQVKNLFAARTAVRWTDLFAGGAVDVVEYRARRPALGQ